ncbi:MAG: ATP-binding protein [Ignavibacteria bacterium]
MFLVFYIFYNTELHATLFIIILTILYQIIALIKFINHTNDELARFILSIKYSDFSQSFSSPRLGKSFSDLSNAFNEVMKKFRETRSEKEEHAKFLQTVMQHIGIGLIAFDNKGKITLINNAAKRIFKIQFLNNIASLNRVSQNLGNELAAMKLGDKITIKLIDANEIIQLLAYATELKMRNEDYTLIAIQNIQSELEEKEMEAWQKLIRVLTHEIMNSITPISSLASTINTMISEPHKNNIFDSDDIDDIKSAMSTIQKRSDGLIHFVNNYRNLTKIPKPNFQIFPVKNLFERVEKLTEKKIKENGISSECLILPENLELTADIEMLEQVLLNLVINSIHALRNTVNAEIRLIARLNERGKTIIKVIDNGPGIPDEVYEKIFIPFFTTKKDGSGIGLSLSRQIVRAHGGNIRVSSIPNKETSFTLRF